MKQLLGFMVEVEVKRRGSGTWMQAGFQKHESQAKLAAGQAWFCGKKVLQSRITPYYQVDGKVVPEKKQAVEFKRVIAPTHQESLVAMAG